MADMAETAINFDESGKELYKILDQISNLGIENNQGYKNDIFTTLEEYYQKYERHLYSTISSYIEEKKDDDTISYLSAGVKDLYEDCFVYPEHIELAEKLYKLYDHISLEYDRLNAVTKKFEKELKESRANVEKLNDTLNELQTKIDREEKKIDLMGREYIAILGIFAAIVITFVGEMVFSTSVLANAHKLGDIFTIVAVVAMIALSFANILLALFDFIGKMVKDDWIIKKNVWIGLNVFVFGIIILILIAA